MVTVISGCSSTGYAPPDQITAPVPILDNSGKYMCPYRQDGSLTDWSSQIIAKVVGAEAGKRAGFMLGAKFMGGAADISKKMGDKAGQKLALEAVGGMEGIRRTSDISFNSLEDLGVYMYVNYSEKDNYKNALRAMYDIYPEFKTKYKKGLALASGKARK
jgi:hypothetical protein